MTRSEALAALRANPEVSVLVIGAGINGIGTFRDLALNDVDVLLVDRLDFCSGASAASSHMAHGGIRYLENGEFRLVREAIQERNRLIRNAPHLVRPLPTTIPIFRALSGLLNAPLKFAGLLDRPSERGALVIKLGLLLYDAYAGRERVLPTHRFRNRSESLRQWSRLNPSVRYTATYFDGAILQPERLGLELILDAEAANPEARALNYVSVVRQAGTQVVLRDELTGSTYEARPHLVVNATGPWIDNTNQALGLSTRLIGGTKGSHLVLRHPALRAAIGDHEFFFENKDGRIVLIFPLFDRVLVGTSDIPVSDPDEVRCTEEEVDYFIEMIAHVFPLVKVAREDIVFRFSGVRPLAASTTRTTGQITRDHEIEVAPAGSSGLAFPVYSLVGGKWTSFRAFSEQVTDKALSHLGKTRQIKTVNVPIGGGRNYPLRPAQRLQLLQDIATQSGLSGSNLEQLFERYGTRTSEIAQFIMAGDDTRLPALQDYSHREVGFIALHEKVAHLDDFLLRRSMLAMLGRVTRDGVNAVGHSLAEWLGWDARTAEAEVARALQIMRERHQVEL